MMENKFYTIERIKFTLNTDLTLDESEEVTDLFSGLSLGDKTISGKFSGTQIKRFLEIVLTPEKDLPPDFSFGKTKESVQLEVFKDFFLERLSKITSSANLFEESINKPLGQSGN